MFSIPNRYLIAIKEYTAKFMGQEKAEKHTEILERTMHQIITDSDFRNYVQMMIDVYEAGYVKAYQDCLMEFEKHGINTQLIK